MFSPPRMISSLIRPVMVRVPGLVAAGQVTGVVPAVAQRVGGRLGLVVVAEHDVRPAHPDLALVTGGDVLPALRVDQAHGEPRHRQSARALDPAPVGQLMAIAPHVSVLP